MAIPLTLLGGQPFALNIKKNSPERGFGFISQTLFFSLQFLLGDIHFWSVGLGFLLFHFCCDFLCCYWFLCFLFSVTLPGTNAPRSAVTRGKPILFWFLFRFQGSLSPFLVGTSFSASSKCLFWFSWVFCDILVFCLAGSSTGGILCDFLV